MNLAAMATELLSRRLGLSPELLGARTVERALEAVFSKTPHADRGAAAARLLKKGNAEWQGLVEEVIVPETWFFRDREPFRFLSAYVQEKWLPANPAKQFQVLCIPCASGEEPYSIAISLLAAGLEGERVRVDAADISERLLGRARAAVYGKSSFREKFASGWEKYFMSCAEGRRVSEAAARLVRYEKANLLDLARFRARAPYDAIFCRNALIYFHESARREVVSRLSELLAAEGLLFTGHAELAHFCGAGYAPVEHPQSFACRKAKPAPARLPVKAARARAGVQRAPAAQRAMPVHARPAWPGGCEPGPAAGLEEAQRRADRGDLEAARAICEALLAAGRQDADLYALLGAISASRGNEASAEEYFRKALYLAPDHYDSLLHMSVICERRGNLEGSRLYRARASRQERGRVLKAL